MSERLEKHIEDYFGNIPDNKDLLMHIQHFYNFALEDVTKDVESYKINCGYSRNSEDTDYWKGKNDACVDILQHIDNLTK